MGKKDTEDASATLGRVGISPGWSLQRLFEGFQSPVKSAWGQDLDLEKELEKEMEAAGEELCPSNHGRLGSKGFCQAPSSPISRTLGFLLLRRPPPGRRSRNRISRRSSSA